MSRQINIKLPESIHCRIYGEGPAIMLFHPSPNSSLMMEPFAQLLAEHHTVICPDTPGYGQSEKLNIESPAIVDYAHQFKRLIDALEIDQCAIYGSATGAQIAIRLGIEFPEAVSHLFLDNCAHFTDEEREAIKADYFPDLQPDISGSHLDQVWDIVSHLFQYFPWCFKDDEHRLNGPVPSAEVLHGIALDYLRAGTDYDLAYRAAFDHEKAAYIQALTVPATIFRWEGSILKKYTDRIFKYELGENISSHQIPADHSQRLRVMSEYVNITKHSESQYSQDLLAERTNEPIAFLKIKPSVKEMQLSGPLPLPEHSGEYLLSAWNKVKSALASMDSKSKQDRAISIQKQLVKSYTINKQY